SHFSCRRNGVAHLATPGREKQRSIIDQSGKIEHRGRKKGEAALTSGRGEDIRPGHIIAQQRTGSVPHSIWASAMSRKYYLTAAGIMLVLLGCTAAGLILLIRHEPAAYRRTAVPPGPDRKERSGEAASQFSALYTALQTGNEFDWAVDLTDE